MNLMHGYKVTLGAIFLASTLNQVNSQGCTLCEDGSPVPNPDFQIVPQANCAGVEGFVFSSEPSETCPARQAAAGVYCGCDNPIAVLNVCRICGGDTWLPDPGRSVNSTTMESIQCGTVEYMAYNSTNCTDYQAFYGEDCCDDTMDDISPSPTEAPTPSSSASSVPAMIGATVAAIASGLLSMK